MNPLVQLNKEKQSFWLDFIRRELMTSGELARLIKEDNLTGMTSNPTIFQKALESGREYDDLLKKTAAAGKSLEQIFEEIAVRDIQAAADALRPIYNRTEGLDGYVSLEVNPKLAYRPDETLLDAKRLFKKVNRPNLMIKIPGTLAGLKAIEEALFLGINVNVTLLFSVDLYKKVADSYIRALERRLKKGLPIHKIGSVASFFVSRVDTMVDKELDNIIAQGGEKGPVASFILHKAAIANAKLAYEHFMTTFRGPRFEKLKNLGAQNQRLLWASTGTKDKRLSDVIYVEELIGPDTVNTIPPATVDAFRDHGKVEPRLLKGLDEAKEQLNTIAMLGIDMNRVTDALEKDGVKAFIDSYDELLRVIGAKKELLLADFGKRISFDLGPLEPDFQVTLDRIRQENWMRRIWVREANFWKAEEDHQKIIKNSLGWLSVMNTVLDHKDLLDGIVHDIRKGRFTHVLLLGMGGSSLAPEVLRLTFGKKQGYPDFSILDSTEPASVLERAGRSKPEKTLYIVASKSGSTIEPNAFLSYFYDLVEKKKGMKAGENFLAITDPGTSMEKLAREKKFRHIVLNPPDIGGRFSALSFFGMLPAALMGIDVQRLLERARDMAAACYSLVPTRKNPAALLGAALGVAAKGGRNKITFFFPREIQSFGTWVEQLIAESTGKEGTGCLPVESEELSCLECYGEDRVFVFIGSERDKSFHKKLVSLEKAGHPVIRITTQTKFDIGAQLFLWEMATAVMGAVLKINPFDQPNVQEAKDLTKRLLGEFDVSKHWPYEKPYFEDQDLTLYWPQGFGSAQSLEEVTRKFLDQIRPSDYVALLAYLTRNEKMTAKLQEIRHLLLRLKKVATTVGFGPRYLHSTGQYHKGGDNHGIFISFTATDKSDAHVPGEVYPFSVLKEAQARGDWGALKAKERRVLHLHLKDPLTGLERLKTVLEKLSRT